MASKTATKKQIKIGKTHEGTEPKPGYVSLAEAHEGRKRPDGLGRGWQ